MSEEPSNAGENTLPPGTKVGSYRIEHLLGRGGMADVYYAIHEALLRPVALKILRAALASDSQHLQRFQQEARAAANLIHPNIVQVYDVDLQGPYRFIAQEYVPGANLRQYMARYRRQRASTNASAALPDESAHADGEQRIEDYDDQPLPIRETLSILLQVLAALSKSYREGIVHRDIKPENIMLTKEGDAKVTDFGLARVLYGDDLQLTQAGTTMGTPLYMSPEQIQDGKVDIRSDLYSLGVTLFHMLTGRPPFVGDTPLALAMKHVQATPPDIRQLRSDIPESLANLVMRLLAKDPQDRFSNPMQIIDYLQQHRTGDLAPYWPEQSVLLPDVTRSGPASATVELQSQLLAARRRRSRRVLQMALVTALVLTALAAGFSATYHPRILPAPTTEVFRGIPRQENVREQYLLALLSKDLHSMDKWRAVGFYFPKEENETNRSFVAQADIQLARTLQERREYAAALQLLDTLIADTKMPAIYRVLALLQKASIYEELEDDEKFQSSLEAARRMASAPDFPTGDRQRIDEVARHLGTRVALLWLGD